MTAAELFTTVDGLSGPADADNFRMTVDWGRWYIDPLPTCEIAEATEDRWPSYTGVKGAAGKDWSFLVPIRFAKLPTAELHRIADLDPIKRLDTFKSHANFDKQISYGRGTIVHLWFQDLGAGREPREITDRWLSANKYPIEARNEALRYRAAIVDFWNTYQPELVLDEYAALHRTLHGVGYGCTPDAILRIDGLLQGVDYKTRSDSSDHAAYAEEAAQIAAGAFAEYMIVRDGDTSRRERLPKLDGGLVISIKTDGARLYPIDLDKAWEHFCRLHQWYCHKQTEKASISRVLPKRSGASVAKLAAPAPAEPAPTGTGASVPVDDPVHHCVNTTIPDGEHDPTSNCFDNASWEVTQQQRRTELRRRYNLLNEHDQAKFRGLFIDPNDLDLIETHLDGLDAFTNVHAEPAGKPAILIPTPVPPQRPKVVPIPEPSLGVKVEGEPVSDAEWSVTAHAFDQLDEAGKTFVKDIVAEAHAAQQWMSGAGGNKTTRRLHLLRGLVTLAAAEMKGEL